ELSEQTYRSHRAMSLLAQTLRSSIVIAPRVRATGRACTISRSEARDLWLSPAPPVYRRGHMGRRNKRSLKSRPKFKQKRRLKDRRMKARKRAWHKRGLARNKARRRRRGKH